MGALHQNLGFGDVTIFYINCIRAAYYNVLGFFIPGNPYQRQIEHKINTGWPIKIRPHSFNFTCSHDTVPSNFKIAFFCYYAELSFGIYNAFLGQLA